MDCLNENALKIRMYTPYVVMVSLTADGNFRIINLQIEFIAVNIVESHVSFGIEFIEQNADD